MKWIQYSFLACLILLNTNVFSQSSSGPPPSGFIRGDIKGVKWDVNKHFIKYCKINLPGLYYMKNKSTPAYFELNFTPDRKTDTRYVYERDPNVIYFKLIDDISKTTIANLTCTPGPANEPFQLPASCQNKIPLNKTLYLKGKVTQNHLKPSRLQFTDISCSIK